MTNRYPVYSGDSGTIIVDGDVYNLQLWALHEVETQFYVPGAFTDDNEPVLEGHKWFEAALHVSIPDRLPNLKLADTPCELVLPIARIPGDNHEAYITAKGTPTMISITQSENFIELNVRISEGELHKENDDPN